MRLQKDTWKHLSPRLDLSVAGKYLCVAVLTPFACKACPPSCPQKLRSLFFTKGKHLNLIRFFHIKHKELCLGSLSISNVLFSCSALCQGSAYIWMHCPFHLLFPASYNLSSPAILFSSGGHLESPNCWLLQYRYRYWPLNCFNTYFNVLFLNLSLHLRSLTSIFYQFSFKLSAALSSKPVLFTYFIVLIVDLQCYVVSGI